MKKRYTSRMPKAGIGSFQWITFALICCISAANAQVSLTTLGSAYTQNFDGLANSGTTNSTLPTGWTLNETGGSARDNEQYAADDGGSNTGDAYSYGADASTERAFGGLQSGSLVPTFGASFTNNTGSTITSLEIAYTGEQWRIGNTAASRDDRLDFQYSLDATSLTTGSWTDVNVLDFTNPIKTAATAGGLNGNAAANRILVTSTITGLSIANGATFWIRWNDLDALGTDDGLAVDDFSLTPQGASCSDGMQNGTETGVDCGGPCAPCATMTNIYEEDFEGTHNWTLNVSTGTNGGDPNFWVVSDAEGGVTPPGCGVANNGDKTLHVTSVFNPTGGAAYDAGGLCGISFCPETNARAESPSFATTGHSGLILEFDYIANGDGLTDNASVWYNTGSGWTLLVTSLKSPLCISGQGQWTHYTIALPASFDNNPSVKIGFNWTNNDDGVGTDPSVAINNIVIKAGAALCAISSIGFSDQQPCDDNETSDPSDDFYTADITVNFSNPPATGFLELEQDGAVLDVVNIPVGSLVGNSHTFQDVRLKANGMANAVEAQFSADQQNCVRTIPAPVVNSCSPVCSITSIMFSDQQGCDNNDTQDPSDDFYTADITINFMNPPATGFLELEQDGAVIDVVNIAVGSLVGNSHTFQDVRLKANGMANAVEAQFSADQQNCVRTIPAPTVNSCPCDADAGMLSGPPSICQGGTADLENVGNNTSGTYIQLYFLTDNSPDKIVLDFRAFIEQEQGAGNMEDLIATLSPGEYCIYSLNFQSTQCQPTLGSESLADFLARCLDGVCYDLSDPLCITVNAIPTGTFSIDDEQICDGEETFLRFNATTGTGPFTITFGGGKINPGTTTQTAGNNNPFWTLNADWYNIGANTYTITQIEDANNCTTILNEQLNLQVDPRIVANALTPQTICSAKKLALANLNPSVTYAGNAAELTYTWSIKEAGNNGMLSDTNNADPTAGTYMPGADAINRGYVTLVLTVDNPNDACEAVAVEVQITILKVDCGAFPWNGN